MGDGECFRLFVAEGIKQVTEAPDWGVSFKGHVRPFGEILYKWLRCTLAHEGELPPEISFVPDPEPGVIGLNNRPGPPERIEITHSVVILLTDIVARAAENSDVPSQLRDLLLSLRLQGARGAGGGVASPRKEFDPPAIDLLELYVRAMRAGTLAQWGAPVVDSQVGQVEQVAIRARRELRAAVQEYFSRAEGELLMSIGGDLLKSGLDPKHQAELGLRANLGSGMQEVGRTILARLGD